MSNHTDEDYKLMEESRDFQWKQAEQWRSMVKQLDQELFEIKRQAEIWKATTETIIQATVLMVEELKTLRKEKESW